MLFATRFQKCETCWALLFSKNQSTKKQSITFSLLDGSYQLVIIITINQIAPTPSYYGGYSMFIRFRTRNQFQVQIRYIIRLRNTNWLLLIFFRMTALRVSLTIIPLANSTVISRPLFAYCKTFIPFTTYPDAPLYMNTSDFLCFILLSSNCSNHLFIVSFRAVISPFSVLYCWVFTTAIWGRASLLGWGCNFLIFIWPDTAFSSVLS